MIRHSPAERYIRYLILDNPQRTEVEVQDLLDALGLDSLTKRYIAQVKRSVTSGIPSPRFYPRNRSHAPSMHFIAQHQVYDLFNPDRDTSLAFDLLELPRAKAFVEFSLQVQAPPQAVASHIARFYGMPSCTAGAVKKYGQFFYDMTLIDETGLRALIRRKFTKGKLRGQSDEMELGECIAKSMYNDPRWIAANLPHNPFSALIAQISIGLTPPEFNIQEVLHQAEKMAALRMIEELYSHGPDYDRRYLNLQTAMRITQEMQQTKENPQDNLRAQLEAIQLRMDQKALPQMSVLSGGRHTTDLDSSPTSKEPVK